MALQIIHEEYYCIRLHPNSQRQALTLTNGFNYKENQSLSSFFSPSKDLRVTNTFFMSGGMGA